MTGSDGGGIGAIIDTVKAAGEIINAVVTKLNGSRSVVVEVDNNTDFQLTYATSQHDHGGFSSELPNDIPPKSVDVFGSQSNAWSVGTGTEGTVTYQGDEFRFYAHWDNPFLGSNDCSALVLGRRARLFQTKAICGNGNEGAHMRFVLSPSTRAFVIRNRQTGKVLDVPDSALENNVIIQQYDRNDGHNQQWLLLPKDGENGKYYIIQNRYSDLVLDVADGSTADHALLQQYDRNDGHNQQWRLLPATGGFFPLGGSYFKIANRNSSKILDVPGGSNDNQVQIQQLKDNGGFNQQWDLIPI